jgi:hypothetical protein
MPTPLKFETQLEVAALCDTRSGFIALRDRSQSALTRLSTLLQLGQVPEKTVW